MERLSVAGVEGLAAVGLAARGREDGGLETAEGTGFVAWRRADVWRLRAACNMGLRRIACAI